jgi:large subunit ribosomal protein L24
VALHVKKGDTVEVIAGDDHGARGKVLSVDPVNRKVVVEGLKRSYRHVRPSRRNPQGGRLQIEQPIDISSVLPINPKTNKPTRVRFIVNENGEKKRVALDGTVIDVIRKVSK